MRRAAPTRSSPKGRAVAAGIVLVALVAVPAPLLPPQRVAQAVQAVLGVGWKAAYLIAAMSLHFAFYGVLGVVATFALRPAPSVRGQWLQIVAAPLIVAALAILIQSIKLGHIPILTNAIVPISACVAGVGLGLWLRYGGPKSTLAIAAALAAVLTWGWLSSPSAELTRATELHLRRLVAVAAHVPAGDDRFGALVQAAFAPMEGAAAAPAEHNRAALLALGIALADERLARFVGLPPDTELLRQAAAVREGTTMNGRPDWPMHFTLSAALTVLRHPFASDAAGLLKEELDAITGGSGFSFADLAADRAGVKFAVAATDSDAAARAMQARLQRSFVLADFFPRVSDLPENLTVEQFRSGYGGVGSPRYRELVSEIEARLNSCPGLVVAQ